MPDLQRLASDPDTPGHELADLAAQNPHLRPLVALNRNSYPELLEWLGALNDPAINLALRQRRATLHGQARQTGSPKRQSVMNRGASPQVVGDGVPAHSTGPSAAESTGHSAGHSAGLPAPPSPPPPSPVGDSPADAWERLAGPKRPTPPTPSPRPAKSSRNWWAWAAGFLVAAVLGAGAFWLLPGRQTLVPLTVVAPAVGGEGAQSTASQSGAESQQEDANPKEAARDETDWEFAAPDSAFDLSHFALASGNILCRMEEDAVTCTVLSHTYPTAGLADCGVGPATFRADQDFSGLYCGVEPVTTSGGTTMSYGDYTKHGESACLAAEQGVSCWNQKTGEGFAVARQGYVIGSQGLIPPEHYPWG